MLNKFNVLTNIAVKDLDESKKFYGELLGLNAIGGGDYGQMYESGPDKGHIFIYPAPTAGTSKATICSWEVEDIKKLTDEFAKQDIKFERYNFPGAEHDGPVHIMGGMKAAWFRDPSGNILGLSEGHM